jgi:hypothetical protein
MLVIIRVLMLEEESNLGFRREGRPLDKSIFLEDPKEQPREQAAKQEPVRRRRPQSVQNDSDFFGLFECCMGPITEPEFETAVQVQELSEHKPPPPPRE